MRTNLTSAIARMIRQFHEGVRGWKLASNVAITCDTGTVLQRIASRYNCCLQCARGRNVFTARKLLTSRRRRRARQPTAAAWGSLPSWVSLRRSLSLLPHRAPRQRDTSSTQTDTHVPVALVIAGTDAALPVLVAVVVPLAALVLDVGDAALLSLTVTVTPS
jgi:hypothetical protein